MLKSLLLSLFPRLAPGAALHQASDRLFRFRQRTRIAPAPDLACMLRREVGLPEQPTLLASDSGDQFTVTANLQAVGIDSLQIGITQEQFTLSGWLLQPPSHATGGVPECGGFSASRAIPPSMDLEQFTLHYHQGHLIFRVPKKSARRRDSTHTPAPATEYYQ